MVTDQVRTRSLPGRRASVVVDVVHTAVWIKATLPSVTISILSYMLNPAVILGQLMFLCIIFCIMYVL